MIIIEIIENSEDTWEIIESMETQREARKTTETTKKIRKSEKREITNKIQNKYSQNTPSPGVGRANTKKYKINTKLIQIN